MVGVINSLLEIMHVVVFVNILVEIGILKMFHLNQRSENNFHNLAFDEIKSIGLFYEIVLPY